MKIYVALIRDSFLNTMDHLSFTLLMHRGLTATPIQNTANDLTSLASWIGIKGNLKDVKVSMDGWDDYFFASINIYKYLLIPLKSPLVSSITLMGKMRFMGRSNSHSSEINSFNINSSLSQPMSLQILITR